jgi:hypothetical protein
VLVAPPGFEQAASSANHQNQEARMSRIELEGWLAAVNADQRIGYTGKQVAGVLARNLSNGACQLSFERIADHAGITTAEVVRKAVDRLKTGGWILVEKPADANHHGRGLKYRPSMPAEMIKGGPSREGPRSDWDDTSRRQP